MGAIILGEYQPVPIEEAMRLCEAYAKAGCIIVSYDRKYERTNVTTYGVDAASKDWTAMLGDVVGRLFDGTRESHEDFRATPAAQMKEAIDKLTRENADLRQRINRMEAGS